MTQETVDIKLPDSQETVEPMEYDGYLINLAKSKEGPLTTIYEVVHRDSVDEPLQPNLEVQDTGNKYLDEEQEEEFQDFLAVLKAQIPDISPERMARERHLFEESIGTRPDSHKDRDYDLAVTALELLNDPDKDPYILVDAFDEYYELLLKLHPEQLFMERTEDNNPYIVHFRPYAELEPGNLKMD